MIKPRFETPDPENAVGTYGDRALKWAKRELGITAGPWQAYVIRKILRYDKDGDLIHRTVLLGCARQNGKSIIVRIIVGWVLDEGRKLAAFSEWTQILAAAHDAKQARIIYGGVYADLVSIPRLSNAATGARHGREVKLTELFGIRMGRLSFDTVTSQPGSARGKSAGLIVFDEVLTQRDWDMWRALSPTQSAQRNPLMILTSTAGDPESIVLRDHFDRLVRQSTGADAPDPTFYGAWWQSSDPEAGLDWPAIAEANPALDDGRLSKAFIEGEWAGPRELWRQERLNHWAEGLAASAFGPGQWDAGREARPIPDDVQTYALGVSVGPDWQRATVCAAAVRPDGRVGVEVYRDLRADKRPITAADVIAAVHEFPYYAVAAAYDASSAGAPSFRRDAEDTGFQWDELTPSATVAACMDVAEMVSSGVLVHDDPLIDAQVMTAGRRPVGLEGAFRFARSVSTGPIDAFLAAVYAAHAARYNADVGIFLGA